MTQISIILNGQRKDIDANLNIRAFLTIEGYKDMVVAVARNGKFVARDSYDVTFIRLHDDIEIVAPMQGG